MGNVSLRQPRDEDWPALAALGNTAISEMSSPPDQTPWAENRRSFPADGIQRHFVAISDGRIVGYAGAEWRTGGPHGWYRVFVIIAPQDRATLGRWLFGKIRETLISLSAATAWMMEYEDDKGLLAFMEQVGFKFFRSLTTNDGFRVVEMTMDAPFDSLKISN
jgi:Acetyltransferase (GNAT) domain